MSCPHQGEWCSFCKQTTIQTRLKDDGFRVMSVWYSVTKRPITPQDVGGSKLHLAMLAQRIVNRRYILSPCLNL